MAEPWNTVEHRETNCETLPALEWIRLKHSNTIHSCAYDLPSRTLFVRFLRTPSGELTEGYTYADVPAHKFYDLRNSKAPGRYFAREIKPQHAARRIEL